MNASARITASADGLRHDWTVEEVEALFALPFMDLLFQAQQVHRANFDPNRIQVSRLISIKTGSCPEDCSYCPQSAHYATGLEMEKLRAVEEVVAAAARPFVTSPLRYCLVISTCTFQDRLDTLDNVREVGLHVCSGGIVGLGETRTDRARMLQTLANMDKHPESVPINLLIAIPGTPLEHAERPDPFDFIRTIAAARIMMPRSFVRLSAGREGMNDEMQALCFLAGANSVFCGHKLLTARNAPPGSDHSLFGRLGLAPL